MGEHEAHMWETLDQELCCCHRYYLLDIAVQERTLVDIATYDGNWAQSCE